MAKDKGDKKPKKDKKRKGAAPESEWPLVSVAEHPRARASIRQAKSWAGLLGLLLVGWLSHRAGVDDFQVGVRALIAGIALYLATWAVSVRLWQQLVLHEAKQVAERRREEREEQLRRLRGDDETAGDDDSGEAAVA